MLKAMYLEHKHGAPLFLWFFLISYHKMILYANIEKKINQKLNYTHTSLRKGTTIRERSRIWDESGSNQNIGMRTDLCLRE